MAASLTLRVRGLRSIGSSILLRGFSSHQRLFDGNAFDTKMLDVLVCPLSKAPLRYDAEKNELVCDEVGVAYPVKNGIPNLVPSDAKKLPRTETKET